jgi:hypothetical protein
LFLEKQFLRTISVADFSAAALLLLLLLLLLWVVSICSCSGRVGGRGKLEGILGRSIEGF